MVSTNSLANQFGYIGYKLSFKKILQVSYFYQAAKIEKKNCLIQINENKILETKRL